MCDSLETEGRIKGQKLQALISAFGLSDQQAKPFVQQLHHIWNKFIPEGNFSDTPYWQLALLLHRESQRKKCDVLITTATGAEVHLNSSMAALLLDQMLSGSWDAISFYDEFEGIPTDPDIEQAIKARVDEGIRLDEIRKEARSRKSSFKPLLGLIANSLLEVLPENKQKSLQARYAFVYDCLSVLYPELYLLDPEGSKSEKEKAKVIRESKDSFGTWNEAQQKDLISAFFQGEVRSSGNPAGFDYWDFLPIRF